MRKIVRDEPNLMTCPDCGKLCARHRGRKWCSECTTARLVRQEVVEEAVERRGNRSVEDIASTTGLSPFEVRSVIKDTAPLRGRVALRESCARCGREEAQLGSDFCFNCRLELYRALGSASNELFTQLEFLEDHQHQPGSITGLVSTLEARRKRLKRFSPVPPFRIR